MTDMPGRERKEFTAANRGDAPVELEVSTGAEWIRVEPARIRLEPRAAGRFGVTLDLARLPAGAVAGIVHLAAAGLEEAEVIVVPPGRRLSAAVEERVPRRPAPPTEEALARLADPKELSERLRRRSSPPEHSGWRAGLMDRALGRDEPWAGADAAWSLLKAGRVEEGRELLRRLEKHRSGDFDGQVLGAFELLRPPEDRKDSTRRVENLSGYAPDCAEIHALMSIGTYTTYPQTSWERHSKALERRPRGPLGLFLNGVSDLCVSDLRVQILYGGVGHEINSVIIQPAVKGVSLLLLRRHAEALAEFRRGWDEGKKVPEYYEKLFRAPLTAAQRESLAAVIQDLSLQGLALTFLDLGLGEEAETAAAVHARERPRLAERIAAGLRDPEGTR